MSSTELILTIFYSLCAKTVTRENSRDVWNDFNNFAQVKERILTMSIKSKTTLN